MSLDDRLKDIDLEIRPLMVGATKYADEAIVTGKPEAKQAILTDLLEIIGEDEEKKAEYMQQHNDKIYFNNKLRQELRVKITEYCKGGDSE